MSERDEMDELGVELNVAKERLRKAEAEYFDARHQVEQLQRKLSRAFRARFEEVRP